MRAPAGRPARDWIDPLGNISRNMSVRDSRLALPPIAARYAINVVENDAGEVLLLKRALTARLAPGLWGFPAGHIEDGETPEACGQRELREEIGADHRVQLLRVIGPIRDTLYGGIYEIHLYHHRWLHGTIVLNHEHTDHAWVGRERFRDYDAMNGIDEDILYLGIWPREYLRGEKLPK